jgi:hypothetical protein
MQKILDRVTKALNATEDLEHCPITLSFRRVAHTPLSHLTPVEQHLYVLAMELNAEHMAAHEKERRMRRGDPGLEAVANELRDIHLFGRIPYELLNASVISRLGKRAEEFSKVEILEGWQVAGSRVTKHQEDRHIFDAILSGGVFVFDIHD